MPSRKLAVVLNPPSHVYAIDSLHPTISSASCGEIRCVDKAELVFVVQIRKTGKLVVLDSTFHFT
jgi:hypothetical protein